MSGASDLRRTRYPRLEQRGNGISGGAQAQLVTLMAQYLAIQQQGISVH